MQAALFWNEPTRMGQVCLILWPTPKILKVLCIYMRVLYTLIYRSSKQLFWQNAVRSTQLKAFTINWNQQTSATWNMFYLMFQVASISRIASKLKKICYLDLGHSADQLNDSLLGWIHSLFRPNQSWWVLFSFCGYWLKCVLRDLWGKMTVFWLWGEQ